MTKKYKAIIQFFFQAEDASDALGIADNIADYVETSEEWGHEVVPNHGTIEAKIGAVRVETV